MIMYIHTLIPRRPVTELTTSEAEKALKYR
jgi:hypothetical protein